MRGRAVVSWASLVSLLLCAPLTVTAFGQEPGTVEPPGDGAPHLPLGGIPYSPWLVPLAFVAGGFVYGAHGWYTSKSRYEIGDSRFRWDRFLKTGASGIVVGIAVFGFSGAAEIDSVASNILAGPNGYVEIHEFGAAVAAAFLVVSGLATTWKRAKRQRAPSPPAQPPGGDGA